MNNKLAAVAVPFLLSACGMPEGARPLEDGEWLDVKGAIEETRAAMPMMLQAIAASNLDFNNKGKPASTAELQEDVQKTFEDLQWTFDAGKIVVMGATAMEGEFFDAVGSAGEAGGLHTSGGWIILNECLFTDPAWHDDLAPTAMHEQAHDTFDEGSPGGHAEQVMADFPDVSTAVVYNDYSFTDERLTHDTIALEKMASGQVYGWSDYTAFEAVEGLADNMRDSDYDANYSDVYYANYYSAFNDVDDPVAAYTLLEDLHENAESDILNDVSVEFYENPQSSDIFVPMDFSFEEFSERFTKDSDYYVEIRRSTIDGMMDVIFSQYGDELSAAGIERHSYEKD